MIVVAVAVLLGVALGWTSSRPLVASISAAVLAVAGQLLLNAIAAMAASTPPILPWEAMVIGMAQSVPVGAAAVGAAGAAWITSRLMNPPEREWREGDPDRRLNPDRRSEVRGVDRRAGVR